MNVSIAVKGFWKTCKKSDWDRNMTKQITVLQLLYSHLRPGFITLVLHKYNSTVLAANALESITT